MCTDGAGGLVGKNAGARSQIQAVAPSGARKRGFFTATGPLVSDHETLLISVVLCGMKWELGTKHFCQPRCDSYLKKSTCVAVAVRAELSPLFTEDHFHWKLDKLVV